MTTAISAATAASATTANSAKQLSADMNTFLTLMTTQMKNQDPLDPMKSSEYTQQLATYSQVEQAIQQTSKLDQILNQMSSQSLTSAASYVGMSVTTQQSTATLGPGGARWSYDVPASATATKLSVVDSSGRVILETVRRQNIWRSARRKLAECGPRLEVDVRRRACGVASADIRWSVV